MTSVFKGSCFIFYITWLLCLTYLLGIIKFQNEHIIYDSVIASNQKLLGLIAYVIIFVGFMGCVGLKCDINSVCCLLLFGIPTLIIIPGACFYGIHEILRVNESSPSMALSVAKSYFKQHERIPKWLTNTENESKCCGINGPHDYREIYRSAGLKTCMNFTEDIPCSCCSVASIDVKRSKSCRNKNDNSVCAHNGSTDWMKYVVYTNSTDPSKLTLKEKCNDSSQDLQFHNPNNKNKLEIFEKGCYEDVKAYYDMMKSCMLAFYIIFAICPILMLIVYGRNFCKSSLITGVRSDYSLDVERISLLDMPVVDPAEILKLGQIKDAELERTQSKRTI